MSQRQRQSKFLLVLSQLLVLMSRQDKDTLESDVMSSEGPVSSISTMFAASIDFVTKFCVLAFKPSHPEGWVWMQTLCAENVDFVALKRSK